MTADETAILLTLDDGAPVECVNPQGRGDVVLVCEHASPFIPEALADLGLSADDRMSHAVWDPGALDVARAMSAALDAPLVAARVSRLVYDCNRPPDATDAMPETSEVVEIPGNRGLTAQDRRIRTAQVYEPFRQKLAETLAANPQAALVTVHSFTPVWHGQQRAAEIGLLHDVDPALAMSMLHAAANLPARVELNVPYDATDGVTHTLRVHGNGRRNVMIEIRNDLIATPEAAAKMGQSLAAVVNKALNQGAQG